MNKAIISFIIVAGLLAGCNDDNHELGNAEHGHLHGDEVHTGEALEPLAYTLYTDKSELFVEFKPLIVGETSKFAAHFTQLGENFKAVTEGSVTVSLIGNETQLTNKAEAPSSPGIFRLALNPENPGTYQVVFDIQTKEFSDKITIANITVYPDTQTALVNQQEQTIGEEIVYLKEQAWKIDFANREVKKQPFTEIIKTTGQVLPAPGDETTIIAKSKGIITFGNNKKLIGSSVNAGETLCIISGAGLTEGNVDTKYKEAKNNYEKSKIDFERAKTLVKDHIISQKSFQEIRLRYKNAQTAFNTIETNYTTGGHTIMSPIQGYIKNVMISEGVHVEIGQPIAIVSQNRKLILKAELPQKYFSKLNRISSANFITAHDSKIYSTDSSNGKLVSYGKSVDNNTYYIPVNFEIDNNGEIIPGLFVEVFLKTTVIKDALVIPYSALIEEQENYFAYVQISGEGFQKRELKIGASDGMNVQVLAGIKEGERVVTKGAYQIKLATMSGKMPAHGHEH
ncbi:MAG: efflux RND transporter periplasmic adaptor subunit [Candidatus Jettenia sp.]|uniref:Cation efflux transporter n=1 Tax=Candidatus Jettenia caeni TaxID=247490 RepID=I3II26_9BACT|nr:efflux RND transporter periplasmic adaptor subunit [Candidatus Jettenia sp. AMX1]MBC6929282.1 efflux RND transporter periplasmic adaptor subunit [Candidatus Jettenia sp.]NUN23489.1 efflux RND transporter periplasmic adaptor subunit [Candidatus Jettenia caeni]KAA0250958.1 MAG: efflux RND transporter periplasmic adaptor subunit [Candidatus Jettenia sp. AMX1]MCE7880251.1 efflux RND transporter periplasmic adaptor subunit [Candidatus Jettenia sp. AMX1]MCQ3926325.1 efflux RND transporter peripla